MVGLLEQPGIFRLPTKKVILPAVLAVAVKVVIELLSLAPDTTGALVVLALTAVATKT